MTVGAVRAGTPRAAPIPSVALSYAVMLAGCVALYTRPVSPAFTWITVAVGLAGLQPVAVAREETSGVRTWFAAVALGVAAFAFARGALGGSLIPPPNAQVLGAGIVAGVAEEAFFRRLVYAGFLRWGVPVALAVSSASFAIVHVVVWGWRAVPVDLAAGVLLGWQRLVTGSWTAPAVTHAAANVVMLL
ncbi:MAG: lysostaphin resistance A-like protein [Actinomycetota bacterium]